MSARPLSGFRILLALFAISLPVGAEEKSQGKKSRPPAEVAEEIELDLNHGGSSQESEKFEELKFENSLVIEAKVERPQVQFPLLKEPPPEKPLPFEVSFRERLLEAPRENTFQFK